MWMKRREIVWFMFMATYVKIYEGSPCRICPITGTGIADCRHIIFGCVRVIPWPQENLREIMMFSCLIELEPENAKQFAKNRFGEACNGVPSSITTPGTKETTRPTFSNTARITLGPESKSEDETLDDFKAEGVPSSTTTPGPRETTRTTFSNTATITLGPESKSEDETLDDFKAEGVPSSTTTPGPRETTRPTFSNTATVTLGPESKNEDETLDDFKAEGVPSSTISPGPRETTRPTFSNAITAGPESKNEDETFDDSEAEGFLAWAALTTFAIILMVIKRLLKCKCRCFHPHPAPPQDHLNPIYTPSCSPSSDFFMNVMHTPPSLATSPSTPVSTASSCKPLIRTDVKTETEEPVSSRTRRKCAKKLSLVTTL